MTMFAQCYFKLRWDSERNPSSCYEIQAPFFEHARLSYKVQEHREENIENEGDLMKKVDKKQDVNASLLAWAILRSSWDKFKLSETVKFSVQLKSSNIFSPESYAFTTNKSFSGFYMFTHFPNAFPNLASKSSSAHWNFHVNQIINFKREPLE